MRDENNNAFRRVVVEDAVRSMLRAIEPSLVADYLRPGIRDTPRRVAEAFSEWFGGYAQDPAEVMRTFEDGAEQCNEMVVLTNIPVESHCEHHMAPFIGKATVAYIPAGRIIGISKIARLVNIFAKRLQVQERLTNQIADAMLPTLLPKGVGVIITCEHMCMATRGVHTPGVKTTTSALRGNFFNDSTVRAEFLALHQKG